MAISDDLYMLKETERKKRPPQPRYRLSRFGRNVPTPPREKQT